MVGLHGYFWSLNGLLDLQTGSYHGGNAIREWNAKGCLGSPPLNREGSDWYEGAFHREVMGDFFDTSCGDAQCPLGRWLGGVNTEGFIQFFLIVKALKICHKNSANAGQGSR